MIIRDDLATNKQLAIRGRDLGLDTCVIKDPGTATVSPRMIATTLEAIIGAVFVDSGANGLDTVHRVIDRLGFFNHAFFVVTYCDSQALALTDTQIMIRARPPDPG